MPNIIVAGSGTDVGKTIISAILTKLLEGSYWKPIECGDSDTTQMKLLIDVKKHPIYKPAYSLKAPVSPHHAALLEGISINLDCIQPPKTNTSLIIESAGGVFTPLTSNKVNIDLFKSWGGKWVIVSKHYLGSINHTLLTVDALKRHGIAIAGIIFNGIPNPETESAILEITKLPLLARLLPEPMINSQTIQRYAKQWKSQISQLLH